MDKNYNNERNLLIKDIINCSEKKLIEKQTKYFLAHINGEILSLKEKLFKRIDIEFLQKKFIGDILINENEEL